MQTEYNLIISLTVLIFIRYQNNQPMAPCDLITEVIG